MNIEFALTLAEPLVFSAEGCRLTAYLDTLAKPPKWTIGHGQTWVDGRAVHAGMMCTQAQADAWAAADLRVLAELVLRLVTVTINEHQLAALTSLAYNVGAGEFQRSSVLEALNLGFAQRAADRFLEYDEAGGRTISGLETRRARERALFLSGLGQPAVQFAAAPALARAQDAVPTALTTDELNKRELDNLDPPLPPAA